jgi:predicted nucleotidyltransferase
MNRDDALAKLRQHEADLKRMGVRRLYLFGSTARGEARPDSDVDLFFDHERGALSLFDVMDIAEAASEILGCKADVMTRSSIDRYIRPRAEAEAVPVF